MGVWEVEGGFELGLVFSGTDLVGQGSPADQQCDGINEERFTGPGLPGQDCKPGLELKTELIGIELSHLYLSRILFAQFLDDRSDHLARTTPDSPEIYHHELRGLHNLYVPRCILDLECIACHVAFPLR